MNKELKKAIAGLGFDGKEAVVYLACLELDGADNSDIAKKSKLNRITNYEVLKRLEKHGAVGSYKRRGAKHFLAVDPRVLFQQSKEKLKIAEDLLPQFLAITNNLSDKPKMYFFEGLDGIKNIYHDSLQAKGEILTFTNAQDIEELLGKFLDNYYEERLKRKIKVRALAPADGRGRHAKQVGSRVGREVKLFDKNKYNISNEIMIYNDKVAIYSSRDKMGVIIQNTVIFATMKNIWQMVWDSLPE
ncbi:MAG: helix-turn-helix domain-containing protein [Candidatus Magasanikbacteria bacterium]